jgi:membrane fusion protein, multidrug efflux system
MRAAHPGVILQKGRLMRRLRLLTVLVVASTSITACGGGSSQQGQGGPGGGGQQGGRGGPGGRGGGQAIPVKAGPVMVEQVTYKIQAVGTLEPEDMVQVTAEVDGVLAEVKFREGDRVTTNTVIAQIDPDRYKLEFDRAEAAYRRTVADAKNATATLARREALAKEQLVSIEDLNSTRTASERFEADVASAKAARDIAAQNLSRSAVKPRHGGVIDKRLVDTGTYIRTGTNIATLVDLARLRLRFKVSETESLRAGRGQAATFKVAATGDREFRAQIYHVGEVADPESRQVEVLAWVSNPGVLKPGFFAEVTLPSNSKKDALVVPETAIQASDRGFIAFVIQDNKVTVRPVELGPRTGGGRVEILTGLKAGETIVYEGSDRISNGATVTTEGRIPGQGRQGGGEGGDGQGQGRRPGGRPQGDRPQGDRPQGDAKGPGGEQANRPGGRR